MTTALSRIREVVPRGDFVVLDTETTGIDYRAEIVQIGIIDVSAATLLDTLVRPARRIPPDATAIHGITDEMVASAPTIADVTDQICAAIRRRVVIIYNAEYDMRLLNQSSRSRGLDTNWRDQAQRWVCAMLAYAEHRGEPGRRYGEFKWHRLEVAAGYEGISVGRAHTALDDCRTTLALVRKLAECVE
jgi:DNA polymerase-3 subunit epsilon